jgi:DNA-binding GntR family transcriptional regulator
METIGDLLHESRKATLASGPDPDVAGHAAILEALVNKDPDAAREAMLAHLQHTRDDLVLAGSPDWVTRGDGREAI